MSKPKLKFKLENCFIVDYVVIELLCQFTLNMMLGWGTYSGQFTYSITEVFYYITVVLIFVFYLLLVFTFYIFTSQGDRTYRRVRYNDPAVDNLLEIVSNEL